MKKWEASLAQVRIRRALEARSIEFGVVVGGKETSDSVVRFLNSFGWQAHKAGQNAVGKHANGVTILVRINNGIVDKIGLTKSGASRPVTYVNNVPTPKQALRLVGGTESVKESRSQEAMSLYNTIKLTQKKVDELQAALGSLHRDANNTLQSAIAVKGRGSKDVQTLKGILSAAKKAGGAMRTVEDEIYNAERWAQSIDISER